MNGLIAIGPWRLAAAYVFLVFLLLMAWNLGLRRQKEFVAASLRMTVQLVLAGYLLEMVFETRSVSLTLAILLVMQVFAAWTVLGRAGKRLDRPLQLMVAASLFLGTTFPLAYFLTIVVNVHPWYEPRYFIPIAGMTVGNSMTGITLGLERLLEGVRGSRALIEEALMLGAAPRDALRDFTTTAFGAAVIPTVNSMLGMGLVFLPGMMTGQILAGASPLAAVEYQAAIMMAILGSVSLTVFLLVRAALRSFFNDRAQLREDI